MKCDKRLQRRMLLFGMLISLLLVVPLTFFAWQTHTKHVSAAGLMPYVQGNQILDGSGKPLILQGAHIVSTLDTVKPYVNPTIVVAAQHLNTATFDVMRNTWKMNTVRIATSDYIWQANPTAYVGRLRTAVAYANQSGLYVILSLHEDAKSGSTYNENGAEMPSPLAVTYWKAIATAFKANPLVIFDTFNEPRIPGKTGRTLKQADWQGWLHGGTLPNSTIQYVGQQDMVNAIRGTGAKQIIIVEALQNWFEKFNADGTWSNLVQDPLGNIVYSAHNYFTSNDLTTADLNLKYGNISSTNDLLAKVPMFVGEWALTPNVAGLGRCSFTPNQAVGYVQTFLQFIQQNNISWTAYSFSLKQLFLDYTNYTPTQLAVPQGAPPWICGLATPIVGDGRLVLQYLLAHPSRPLQNHP